MYRVLTLSLLIFFSFPLNAYSLYRPEIQLRLQDSDKDGVIEGRDWCPSTPYQVSVDHHGCPVRVQTLYSANIDVEFETGSYRISPTSYRRFQSILTLARFLQSHPDTIVLIEGHTDDQGQTISNLRLSQARADTIAHILIDKFRIRADRVKSMGYGDSRPVASNAEANGRARNRRVVAEVVLPYSAQSQSLQKKWTIYDQGEANQLLRLPTNIAGTKKHTPKHSEASEERN